MKKDTSEFDNLFSEFYENESPVRGAYFRWLYTLILYPPITGISTQYYFDKTGKISNESGTDEEVSYTIFARILFEKEYYWTIEHDENRAEDGKLLRDEFAEIYGFEDYSDIDGPCNMLEFLIGLARRMNDFRYSGENEDRSNEYFWEIVTNLFGKSAILKISNFRINFRIFEEIKQKLTDFLDRRKTFLGFLGLFPSSLDGENVEIWRQMQQYLVENG